MTECLEFYIDGRWVAPATLRPLEVINPANRAPCGRIALGDEHDVDAAIAAAAAALPEYMLTTREERLALLERVQHAFERHHDEIARAIMEEVGAPWKLARHAQAASGTQHLLATQRALRSFDFEKRLGTTSVRREPIGVCALITPWNWPINQIVAKVAAALAAGCTMVLKPSEVAPLNAVLFAKVLHEAGVPAGVFNLVNGTGADVGAALCRHPGVDMVSFTGSTRAGIDVARNAARTVKRVTQELGGKSANVLLDDVDFERVVTRGTLACFTNSGQSCNAPTRMLVPRARMREAADIARRAAAAVRVGDPAAAATTMGPLVSDAQWHKVQRLIQSGIDAGATLVCGGAGHPEGLEHGCFVQPTVFADVTGDMAIAREEIFGPVLSILGYDDEDDAVRIANDTRYGLSGAVSSGDLSRARAIAARLRCGMVHINGAGLDPQAPFGGYRESGNGREWGAHGIADYLETKSVYGCYTD